MGQTSAQRNVLWRLIADQSAKPLKNLHNRIVLTNPCAAARFAAVTIAG